MVRPPDREMTAIEKVVCYTHRSQEQGCVTHTEPHRGAPGWIRRQREKEKRKEGKVKGKARWGQGKEPEDRKKEEIGGERKALTLQTEVKTVQKIQ